MSKRPLNLWWMSDDLKIGGDSDFLNESNREGISCRICLFYDADCIIICSGKTKGADCMYWILNFLFFFFESKVM